MPLWGGQEPADRHRLSTGIFAPPVTENKVRKNRKRRSWWKWRCFVRKLSSPSVQACSCAAGNESLTTLCANREEHIKQHNTTQTHKYWEMPQAEALPQSREHTCAALEWHKSWRGCTMYPAGSSDMRATASESAGLTEKQAYLQELGMALPRPEICAACWYHRHPEHHQDSWRRLQGTVHPHRRYLCLSAVRINSA